LAYGNIDGFRTIPFNNPKANFLKDWIQFEAVDFFAGNEAQINWHMMPCSGCLPKLFRSENALGPLQLTIPMKISADDNMVGHFRT
jgi:hypothetical protein